MGGTYFESMSHWFSFQREFTGDAHHHLLSQHTGQLAVPDFICIEALDGWQQYPFRTSFHRQFQLRCNEKADFCLRLKTNNTNWTNPLVNTLHSTNYILPATLVLPLIPIHMQTAAKTLERLQSLSKIEIQCCFPSYCRYNLDSAKVQLPLQC